MSRIQQRAQQDPSSSIDLRRLSRKLQAVHEELDDYAQKIDIFLKAPESDWEALVLKHQTSLTSEFFYHVGRLVQASSEDARRKESGSPPSLQAHNLPLSKRVTAHSMMGGGGRPSCQGTTARQYRCLDSFTCSHTGSGVQCWSTWQTGCSRC